MDLEMLEKRAEILGKIRSFFNERRYLEVDTPLLAPDLIPESCLEVFETFRVHPQGAGTEKKHLETPCWLIPSPEIWMKKLIAQHRRSLFQICKCFRNGESSGRTHSGEFTMVEYYTMNVGWEDSLSITEELFAALLPEGPGEEALRPPFSRISMEEAFSRWAGFDLYRAAEDSSLEDEARRLGLEPPPGLDRAALYDLIFIHAVEPHLPRDRPVALTDYPAFVPCLAKKSAGAKTVERWELYIRGIELANCYTEETDPLEVRRFFQAEEAAKEESALVRHKVDRDYWKIFIPGSRGAFPPCSGVAMGLDRLIMVLTGRSSIDAVLPFPS